MAYNEHFPVGSKQRPNNLIQYIEIAGTSELIQLLVKLL